MGKTVTDENIRVRAYYIWQETGKGANDCWFQACGEMLTSLPGDAKKAAACKGSKKAPAKKIAEKKVEKPAAADVPFYGVKKKK